MTKKTRHPNFEETLDVLRAHGFDATPFTGVEGGVLVSKDGVGAVLVASEDEPATEAVSPGILVRGEVGRLLDRGYQKFIKTSQYEVPASATQLQGIHRFSEELKQLTGETCLYNESLGTTSDRYEYDRLKGRESWQAGPSRPSNEAGGH